MRRRCLIYDKILELANGEDVKLAASFREDLNKEIAIGMTNYMIVNGSLSEGHEKLTKAQRYYQSKKEMLALSDSITYQKISSMEAQADLLDANDMIEEKESDKLRKKAAILKAELKLTSALISMEDLTRQLKAFNSVRIQLMGYVKNRYPNGIEQAEHDNWSAVLEYRIRNGESARNVPMSSIDKAIYGIKNNRPDLVTWAQVEHKDIVENKYNGDLDRFLREEKQLALGKETT